MSNVPVPEETAASWASVMNRIRIETPKIRMMIARRDTMVEAAMVLTRLQVAASLSLAEMERAGVTLPESVPTAPTVPLELLDTPANRRLHRALVEAYAAAREVDRERGHSDDVQAFLVAIALRQVEEEVCPPVGAGE